MSGRWFRLYEEAVSDPKVQSLPLLLFKLWVNLLCIASKNDGVIPPEDQLKAVLSLRYDHLRRGLKSLIDHGLIDQVEGRLEPHNWRKRQYKDDVSTARVQKHRAKMKRVSETAPETETETDRVSEDTNSRARSLFSDFWKAFPKRDGDNPKGKAEAKFKALIEANTDPVLLIAAARRYAELNRETEPRFIPMAFTWLNEHRWQDAEIKPELIDGKTPEQIEREFQEFFARDRELRRNTQ